MNYLPIFLVFLASSGQLVAGNPTNSPNCTNVKALDTLVNQIFGFASSAQQFPQTKEEFKVFCLNQANQIADLELYKSRCPLGDSKRQSLLSLTVISMKHWNSQMCHNEGNNKLSRTLLASATCANEAANGYRACLNRLIEQMEAMKATNVHLRVARMCCSYHRVFSCMSDTASPLPSCTEAAIETNKQYIHLLIHRTMEYLCADYNEVSDKCDKLWKSTKTGKTAPGKVPVDAHHDVQLKPFFNLLLNYLSQ